MPDTLIRRARIPGDHRLVEAFGAARARGLLEALLELILDTLHREEPEAQPLVAVRSLIEYLAEELAGAYGAVTAADLDRSALADLQTVGAKIVGLREILASLPDPARQPGAPE